MLPRNQVCLSFRSWARRSLFLGEGCLQHGHQQHVWWRVRGSCHHCCCWSGSVPVLGRSNPGRAAQDKVTIQDCFIIKCCSRADHAGATCYASTRRCIQGSSRDVLSRIHDIFTKTNDTIFTRENFRLSKSQETKERKNNFEKQLPPQSADCCPQLFTCSAGLRRASRARAETVSRQPRRLSLMRAWEACTPATRPTSRTLSQPTRSNFW